MSDALLEALFAQVRVLGYSEDVIEGIRRNPAQRAYFQNLAESNKDRFLPENPGTCDTFEEGQAKSREIAQKAYEREKNAPLRKPPPLPRYEFISSWEANRQTEIHSQEHLSFGSAMNTFVGMPKESSTKKLDELEPIYFEDMWIPKTHKGFYLLCRSVSHAKAMVGLSLVVEDPKGRIEPIGLYNLDCKGIGTGPDLEEWLPLGTLLAIREPTFKMNMAGSNAIVRVDSPTDVVFLRPDDPLVAHVKWSTPSAVKITRPPNFDYRAHGNSFFKLKKYHLALKTYSDGLAAQPDSDERVLLLLNRSQTHLNLQHPNQALNDANKAHELLSSTSTEPKLVEKAKIRRSKALEDRRLLEAALESYKDTVQHFEESVQAKEGLARVTNKLRQAKTGGYEWKRMVGPASERFEIGDFVGPIKVGKVEGIGGGRGVFTTREVKAGDVLLVEKAFATGEVDPRNPPIALDLRTNIQLLPASIDLITKIMTKIIDDPSKGSFVYSLYGGKNFPPTFEPSFDPLFVSLPTPSEAFIDAERIEGIRSYNSYGSGAVVTSGTSSSNMDASIFIKAAMFNSNCLPNANWTAVGDVVIVRARSDLAKDTEVTLSYAPVCDDYQHRARILKNICECECTCSRCQDDRRAGKVKLERRQKLIKVDAQALSHDVLQVFDAEKAKRSAKKLSHLIALLEATYSPTTTVRPELVGVYRLMSELLDPLEERDRIQLWVKKTLEASGVVLERKNNTGKIRIVSTAFTLTDLPPVDILLLQAQRFSLTGKSRDAREAKDWIRAAIEMDRLTTGRGENDFREAWSKSIKAFKIHSLVEESFATK